MNYSLTKKELIVLPGNYNIKSDLIFPENLKIIFSAGSNFFIDQNKSILVKSDFEIKGTSDMPITIESKTKDKPFGVLAIFGKEKLRMF